jgi:hypothetical protein
MPFLFGTLPISLFANRHHGMHASMSALHGQRACHQNKHSLHKKKFCMRAGRRWLLGLLVLQSTSSVVLDYYQDLLKHHLVITLFLTMLVGAGGNAGNQSAIKVIRGLVSVPAVPFVHHVLT